MLILAIVLGALIGMTLGALGAGGSILAVPVLVHIVGLEVPVATATSLVAVGAAAAVAAGSSGHRSRIRWDIATWFVLAGAIGSVLGAAVGRRLDGDTLLLAFSAVMVLAAYRMFSSVASKEPAGVLADGRTEPISAASSGRADHEDSIGGERPSLTRQMVSFAGAGIAVGFLTGLFGVGGGFVIVPVLALVLALEMPQAVATSLVIVAGNAAVALVVRGVESVDWSAAAAFTLPMLVGSIVGAMIAKRLHPTKSRQAFAALLVAVAVANAVSVVL